MGVLSTAFADMEMRLYTAKGCPHCQHIEPAWNSVQAEIQGKAKHVECLDENWEPIASNQKECDAQNLEGFPTIKLFKNNEAQEVYEGERTSKAMLDWFKEKQTTVSGISETVLAATSGITSYYFNQTELCKEQLAKKEKDFF